MTETNHLTSVSKQSTDKKKLLMLAVIFILPFTIAATLHLLDIRPSGKSFGNLITPPVALSFPQMHDLRGERFPAKRWDKIWSIVMIEDANCINTCLSNVDKLNRVHISLAKEFKRVQRVLIVQGDVDKASLLVLQEKFPDLITLLSNDEDQLRFVSDFTKNGPKGSLYLVDPIGNLMMQYPSDVMPKQLRGDIVRLLKNSWGG